MTLSDLPVLLLDIQATAAASSGGTLLEVGWQRHPAATPDDGLRALLVHHRSIEIPPRLARLTGLSPEDLRKGCRLNEIWGQLQADAERIAAAAGGGPDAKTCPVVVHYGRFERPYLDQLRSAAAAPSHLSLDLVCTHELARRLLPGLPRKGLRAVAGYLGHDTPPERRCAHHLRATGVIWSGLIERLPPGPRITTWRQLKAWMAATPVPPRGHTKRLCQIPRATRASLPHRPGVYRYLSHGGSPLYVGKAKDLNQRLGTYFQPRRRHADHILEMLSRAAELKTTPTPTALEAALLEQDLIKILAPPYNLALRPDTGELQFWSRDFQTVAPRWDRHHPLGPVPGGTGSALLGPLVGAFKTAQGGGPKVGACPLLAKALAGPNHEAPDAACLEAGLGLFLQAHGAIVKRVSPERAPLVIGRRLWSNRHPAPPPEAGNGPPPSPPTSDANDGAAVWTSERVCRCLEHAVCRTAALLRRSRWLGRLGNAVLTWERPDAKPPVCRRLVFRNGRVVARKDLRSPVVPKPAPLPPVPFHWHPHDKITYDRLRVATTELRRLVQERRPITIQPRPVADRPARQAPRRGVLNRAQLARLLSWF